MEHAPAHDYSYHTDGEAAQAGDTLHITLFLGRAKNWRQIALFIQAGMKKLSLTLCHASSPSSELFHLAHDLVLPRAQYGLLHATAVAAASVEKLQADDPFILGYVSTIRVLTQLVSPLRMSEEPSKLRNDRL